MSHYHIHDAFDDTNARCVIASCWIDLACWAQDIIEVITNAANAVLGLTNINLTLYLPLEGVDFP